MTGASLASLASIPKTRILHPREDRVWLDQSEGGWVLSTNRRPSAPIDRDALGRLASSLDIPSGFFFRLLKEHPELLKDLVNGLLWARGEGPEAGIDDPLDARPRAARHPAWPNLVRGIQDLVSDGWVRVVRVDTPGREVRVVLRLARLDPLTLEIGRGFRLEPGLLLTDHASERYDLWVSPVLFAGRDVRTLPLPFRDGEYRRVKEADTSEPGPVLAAELLRGTGQELFAEGLKGLEEMARKWTGPDELRQHIAALRLPRAVARSTEEILERIGDRRTTDFWILWHALGITAQLPPSERHRAERALGKIAWLRGGVAG